MSKTLLITGSTDGIGLAAARKLVMLGHHVLLHGRNPAKLENARQVRGRWRRWFSSPWGSACCLIDLLAR